MGLLGIDAVLGIQRRRELDGRIRGSEAQLDSAALLLFGQQESFEIFGGFLLFCCDPFGIQDRVGVVRPEGAFFGVDGHNRNLGHFPGDAFSLLGDD